MEMIIEIIVTLLLISAGIFGIVGSYGLVKLPDYMTRLHAPTKATTLGVGSALIASMVYFWGVEGHYTWHELMISLFLFLTAPITGNFIAKAHLHLCWKAEDLPVPAPGKTWATYADPDADIMMDTQVPEHEAEAKAPSDDAKTEKEGIKT